MPHRRRDSFRFTPPRLETTAELRWVLLRAFAPPGSHAEECASSAPLALAARLGLAERMAARHRGSRLAIELGTGTETHLQTIQTRAVALELRLDAALKAADEVFARLEAPYSLLKGRALALGGFAPPAGRPAADVDLLVPERRLAELQRALLAGDFRAPTAAAYEHQAPLLVHTGGGALELHRTLPGVRLEGRRSATFEHLESKGLLAPLSVRGGMAGFAHSEVLRSAQSDACAAGDGRPSNCDAQELDARLFGDPSSRSSALALRGDARLPARAVLIAHALVHTLAQHALVATHPGFQMVADLIDLGCTSVAATEPAILRWIGNEVSVEELRAALDLSSNVAAGRLESLADSESGATRLAAHFVACAEDPRYGAALKARIFESPLSDRPRSLARLLLFGRALSPPRGGGFARWLARPWKLIDRWCAARRAARALSATERR